MKMELDTTEFISTLKEYSTYSKKDNEEIVQNRAGRLSFELFKRFKAITPSIAEIRAVAASLDYHIKRKFAGATVKQEIARRINARFTAASGWLPAVQSLTKSRANLKQKNPKGQVIIDLNEPSVTIINQMKEAVAAEGIYSIMQEAIDSQEEDMKVYIERKLEQGAQKYSVA